MDNEEIVIEVETVAWEIRHLAITAKGGEDPKDLDFTGQPSVNHAGNLKDYSIDLNIGVTDRKNNSVVAHVEVSVSFKIHGLDKATIPEGAVPMPRQVFDTILTKLQDTARGVLLHAGAGTVLTKRALPDYDPSKQSGTGTSVGYVQRGDPK